MSLNKVTQLQEQAQELRRPCRSSRAGLISDDYIRLDVAPGGSAIALFSFQLLSHWVVLAFALA